MENRDSAFNTTARDSDVVIMMAFGLVVVVDTMHEHAGSDSAPDAVRFVIKIIIFETRTFIIQIGRRFSGSCWVKRKLCIISLRHSNFRNFLLCARSNRTALCSSRKVTIITSPMCRSSSSFPFISFEPSSLCRCRRIIRCTSIMDIIVFWMEILRKSLRLKREAADGMRRRRSPFTATIEP